MKHRHLLPQEIDLLLDGDAGFGQQPLRAHVRECAECREELEMARELVTHLEHLPHFAPSALFAERVMSQVQVFEPWHVAARDSALRWLPRTRPAQLLVGAMAASVALVLSVGTLYLLARADIALFVWNALAERARGAFLSGLGGALSAAFGEGGAAQLGQSGTVGLALAGIGLLVMIVASALGLRVLAGAARRRHVQ